MFFYEGPESMGAHCTNCGCLKIGHSFAEGRCPGTFAPGPVVQKEVAPKVVNCPIRVTVDAELMGQLDAVAAAKELVELLEHNEEMIYWTNDMAACSYCMEYVGSHRNDCAYGRIKERILAAP